MKREMKKGVSLLISAAMLLCLSACGDGPIMRVVSEEKTVEQKELLPREGEQRSKAVAPASAAKNAEELRKLQRLVDEKYTALGDAAKKAYLTESRYYILLAQQLKNECDVTIGAAIDELAAYESAEKPEATPEPAEGEEAASTMTAEEYRDRLRLTQEMLLELWGELDDVTARFNDYMTIMDALVNHNGIFGLVKGIEEKPWEGSFPTGYFFNDDIPAGEGVSLLLEGSSYVREFGVADAQLYALGYASSDREDTLKLISTMRKNGLLTSVLTDEEDGIQWYGSWIDTGGRTCYYFIWYKEGGLGTVVEKFIGQSAERIVVAGSFDFMTCVLATLNG